MNSSPYPTQELVFGYIPIAGKTTGSATHTTSLSRAERCESHECSITYTQGARYGVTGELSLLSVKAIPPRSIAFERAWRLHISALDAPSCDREPAEAEP
jgi:hypothetical protein